MKRCINVHPMSCKELFAAIIAASLLFFGCRDYETGHRPNILLIMSDNQSWNHVGAYGDSIVKTPNFDRLARHGTMFTHAFCASPSCTPARAALLTGQDIYRLKEGANLWGTLPRQFKVYTDLLEEAGYQVGYEGKGWGPGSYEAAGRKRNPGGNLYQNFFEFLKANEKNRGKPWHYWFSSKHPHRPYGVGSGGKAGIDSLKVKVPSYLPNVEAVKGDIADYYAAIQLFDTEIGELLQELEKTGQQRNTLVIVCSDNGWQMPRGLANLYDFGTRVPLVFSWSGDNTRQGRVIEDLVSLNDLAPTILELAGLEVPEEMTAKSLNAILDFGQKGLVESSREFVVMARERHAFVRKGGLGYPGRAIRTKDFLYIRNLEPDRWPAGDPPLFGDVDAHMLHYPSPAKLFMLQHKDDSQVSPLFKLAFDKRPAEELYDLRSDPDQLVNIANDKAYFQVKRDLAGKLDDYLRNTNDPRILDRPIKWDDFPYYQERDFLARPNEEAKRQLKLKENYNYLE